MKITRLDIENKARCEELVEKKLKDMGVDSEIALKDVGVFDMGELRAATKEYCIKRLQGWLEFTTDEDLTEYFESLNMELWAFIAGYEACLIK